MLKQPESLKNVWKQCSKVRIFADRACEKKGAEKRRSSLKGNQQGNGSGKPGNSILVKASGVSQKDQK